MNHTIDNMFKWMRKLGCLNEGWTPEYNRDDIECYIGNCGLVTYNPDHIIYFIGDSDEVQYLSYDGANQIPFIVNIDTNESWVGGRGEGHGDMCMKYDLDYWANENVEGRVWFDFERPVVTLWQSFTFNGAYKVFSKAADKLGISPDNCFIGCDEGLLCKTADGQKPNVTKEQNIDKNKELEQQRAIHLASQEEKREKLGQYLKDRAENQSAKLTNDKGKEMPRAEYNALRRPYSESKEHKGLFGGLLEKVCRE